MYTQFLGLFYILKEGITHISTSIIIYLTQNSENYILYLLEQIYKVNSFGLVSHLLRQDIVAGTDDLGKDHLISASII